MGNNHTCTIAIDNLSFHQQETNDWCAAACAQMVLHSLSPRRHFFDQDLLRTRIENRSRAAERDIVWFGAPDGLEAALNASRHLPHGTNFRLVASRSEDEVSRHIVWSLERYEIPAVALVYGMRHWVVVRGYTADRPPNGPDDTGYKIQSFDLYDPWPPVPDRRPGDWPPPHVDGRDGCGSGHDRGITLSHVSYDGWRSTGGLLDNGYMTGVPAAAVGSRWRGLFVAIVAGSGSVLPANASRGKTLVRGRAEDLEQHQARREALLQAQPLGYYAPHHSLCVGESEARRRATEALDHFEEPGRERHKAAFAAAAPGQPHTVATLHSEHPPYYLVPFTRPDSTVATVRVDSLNGNYLQSAATDALEKSVVNIMSLDEVAGRLEGREFNCGGAKVIFRRNNMAPDPPLGWKPCRESFSPFYPFYIITMRTRSGSHRLYVRAHDGAAFTRLQDSVAGA